jgi:hypothetical protein
MPWKNLLISACTAQTLKRADSVVDTGIQYDLGQGGIAPEQPMTPRCDCSGFIAWTIGIPREFPPRSQHWLQTTTYWQGGAPVGNNLFHQIDTHAAQPGDVFVYPDSRRGEGHISLVTAVAADGHPSQIVHCSHGNQTHFHDAIQYTPPTVFMNRSDSRVMRIDYNALRRCVGLSARYRLIIAKPDAASSDGYAYQAFDDAQFITDHFRITPQLLADWLNRVDTRTTPVPLANLLTAWGITYRVEMAHQNDLCDPRIYVFLAQ